MQSYITFLLILITPTFVQATKLNSLDISPKIDHPADSSFQPIEKVVQPIQSQVMSKPLGHPLSGILSDMKSGRWKSAKQQAAKLRLNSTSPFYMDALFLSGQIEEQLHNYSSAIQYYQKMLNIDASLTRPRFELARMLFADRHFDSAEKQFRLTLSDPAIPKSVQLTIHHYLAAIKRQTFTWNFSAALTPSDNKNQGTKQKKVIIHDKVFQLSDDNVAQSGIGATLSLSARYQFGKQKQYYLNGSIKHENFSGTSLDNTNIRIGAGYQWQHVKHNLSLESGRHLSMYQGKRLHHGWYSDINYDYSINNRLLWFAHADVEKRFYRNSYRHLNGEQVTALTGLQFRITPVLSGYLLTSASRNKTTERNSSFKTLRLSGTLKRDLNFQALTIGATLDYHHKKYYGKSVFFDQQREDNKKRIALSVTKKDWNWYGFSPSLTFSYTDNDSNIPLYKYKSKDIMLDIQKAF